VHSFSTSAKEKAQLQNAWHNCKTNCTTMKKMHNGNFPLPSHVYVCNFHMSLQFLYEFAIFMSVCNSHVTSPALTYAALHGFYVIMTLNSLTPRQPWFDVEDKDILELSKIDYYLLFKSS
jgi:hypothetical protein